MKRLSTTLLAALATALIAGCGSSHSGSSASTAAQSASTGAQTTSTATGTTGAAAGSGACRTVSVPKPHASQHLKAPTLTLDPSKTYTVTMQTNCGTFAFTLAVKQAPKTAASFYYLAKQGFFTGLTFPRVAADFLIQGGSPDDSVLGGPGYETVEAPPANFQYVRGTVAMGKTEIERAGTAGSQFFIVTAANANQSGGLTDDYALVGKIVSGQSVVDAIGQLPTNPPDDGMPTPAVVMQKVSVSVS